LLALALLGSPWVAWGDEAHQQLALKMIARCNQLRLDHGVKPVAQLNYLVDAAQGHSQEMIRNGYFSHQSPTPGQERPKNRVETSGGWDLSMAENLYRSLGVPENQLVEDVLQAWMNSPVHRQNLLNPKFNSMGIGIARLGKDEWAITQLLSLQSVAIESYQAQPSGSGYQVSLKARVVEGPDQGGVFFQEKVVERWQQQQFQSHFQAPGPGKVMIGQKDQDGKYSIEVEFPIGARLAQPVRTEVPAARP
jgi:hypothetical protein